MYKRNLMLAMAWLALVALLSASCGGPGVTPGPGPGPGPGPDFTRLTAVVTDAAGNPLPGLAIRVDGQPTGVTTDTAGLFALDAAAFPNGGDVLAELAFGKGGIVVGTREIVPSADPDLDIRFGETTGEGTASVSGIVFNASDYGMKPMLGMEPAANMPDFAPTTLDGVEITLFDAEADAVFQTKSANGGQYSFEGVAAGTWQMSAQLEGYYPEMAAVRVEDGGDTQYDFALMQKGVIEPGTGIHVSGVLRDSDTDAPIAGATVNLYADTGYMYMDPPMGDPATGGPGNTPGGAPGDPTTTEPAKDGSMMPELWRPQSATTTTAADGSFTFEDEVAGYSLWLDYSADGYLAGNHWEDINGRTADLELALELSPVIATGVHGRVVNGAGQPVNGARVEFIFGGGIMGMPGFMDFGGIAEDGTANFDSNGAPPPGRDVPPPAPMIPGANGEATAGGGAASPGNDSGGGGNTFDSTMMQRFLWEQQQKGGSDVPADFSGYVVLYTDANGDYSTIDIPAGPYYVMASAYRHLPYAGEAELGADPAGNELDITLPEIPVGSVEGRITDEEGQPVDETLVNATQPNVDPFTYTDGSGNYRIDNVPAGTWLISAFKSGYLTASSEIEITDGGVAKVNLTLVEYTGGDHSTIGFSGSVINGFDNAAVGGADIVFTPLEAELGGYARHVNSDAGGDYATTLVPNTDYNVLVQQGGFEDIFFRFWSDEFNPRMDFWMWPIGAPGSGGGGWNGGGGVRPMPGQTDPASPDGSPPNG